MFNSIFFRKMTKRIFDLRNMVKIVVTCLAVSMMFSGCKDKNPSNGTSNTNSGNTATGITLTLDLSKGQEDDEVIVKCTPACPWAEMGFTPCAFTQPVGVDFYKAEKTGGTAEWVFTGTAADKGWNDAGTEYTYVFGCLSQQTWDGTVTLAPIDEQYLKDHPISGVKSIVIGKNDPVSLKLGY